MPRDLARVEKGEGMPDKRHQIATSCFVENYYWTLCAKSGTKLETRKVSYQKGFISRILNSRKNVKANSFPRNKSKINWK